MKAGDLLPEFEDVLTDQDGAPLVIPDGSTVKFEFRCLNDAEVEFSENAEIVDAAVGTVKYEWKGDETAVAGRYIANWLVIYADERSMRVPSSGYIEYEIEPAPADVSNLRAFVPYIRSMLGDLDPRIPQYSTDAILSAIRLIVNLGKIPDVLMTEDQQSLDTVLDPTDDSETIRENWARVILYASQRFILNDAKSSSFRMRAVAESFGESREQVFALLNDIYSLENGEGGE